MRHRIDGSWGLASHRDSAQAADGNAAPRHVEPRRRWIRRSACRSDRPQHLQWRPHVGAQRAGRSAGAQPTNARIPNRDSTALGCIVGTDWWVVGTVEVGVGGGGGERSRADSCAVCPIKTPHSSRSYWPSPSSPPRACLKSPSWPAQRCVTRSGRLSWATWSPGSEPASRCAFSPALPHPHPHPDPMRDLLPDRRARIPDLPHPELTD
jgi:hypothetical protein